MNGKRIAGRNYKPACGRCEVTPWESCACSALLPELPEFEPMQSERMADKINAEAEMRLGVLLGAA